MLKTLALGMFFISTQPTLKGSSDMNPATKENKQENLFSQMLAPKTLVMILDYDGCLGAMLPNPDEIEKTSSIIKNIYQTGRYERTVLVSGSNRQSLAIDEQNWQDNSNGSSFVAFESLYTSLQEKGVPTVLFKTLKQDRENKKPHGFYWDKAIETISTKHSKIYNNQYLQVPEQHMYCKWWMHEKNQLISELLSILRENYQGQLDCYFIDDKEDLLQDVNAKTILPANSTLKLVRGFFWSLFTEGVSITEKQVFVEKSSSDKMSPELKSQLIDLGWQEGVYTEPFMLKENL